MYIFNEWLFENFPNFIRTTCEEISKDLGLNHSYMKQSRTSKLGISVSVLIDICNMYHLPIAYFFCEKSEIGVYREFTGEYHPARLRMEFLEQLFSGEATSPAHMSEKMLQAHLKNDDKRIGNARVGWYKKVDSLRARELVWLCNELNLDINEIVEDPMGMLPSMYSKTDFEKRCEAIHKKLKKLYKRKKSDSMRKSIGKRSALEARVAELENQNRQLQAEVERLRQELPDIGLAASPDVPYGRK